MPNKYQDAYPEKPILDSIELTSPSAMALLTLEYFEAKPGTMKNQVYDQHHVVINLKEEPHRVENWRNDIHRDFTFKQNEIIVTPAGVKSGWRWHANSKVIIITLEPSQLEHFAQHQLGVVLSNSQLANVPQFIDADITAAAAMLKDALHSTLGSDVMFESFARIFLTKLIQKYGVELEQELAFSKGFTSAHYKRVLEYIEQSYAQDISIESMAAVAGLSTAHFSRLFKKTIGSSPHQFLMSYRIETAKKMLSEHKRTMIDIALSCGFADQAHFSRVFKQFQQVTPKKWLDSISKTK
ncbi:MAG: helix-turn-helix domain-containing protein [Alteromonadaceae bacterium]|nr:helix-turn-helix domain-containing protein [Alteromonadaceae bacterium]